MRSTNPTTRTATAALVALGAAGGVLGFPAAASAKSTDTTVISCSKGANLRADSSQRSRIIRALPKGTRVTYDQWGYKRAEKRWYTHVIKVNGKRQAGWVVYACANPYKSEGAPTPPIPKG
ncbi:SH3 domain-containing protein [Streptomyces sp. NPDC017260]|uniref:SH3 domain-containing protein n=1 Tax=unclassified Streptomyces TaxID=2593676 RepID=UPI003789F2A1